MSRKIYDVTEGSDGNWKGTLRGAGRASVSASTKAKALERTIELVKKAPIGQVVIHKRGGGIQSERTYGADPERSPG